MNESPQINFRELEKKISLAMLGDRFRLKRGLQRIRDDLKKSSKKANQSHHNKKESARDSKKRSARKPKPPEERLAAWQKHLDESIQRLEKRKSNLPTITYPKELPVAQRVDEIKNTIAENQVVIVCGETGSGKSTQLPKMLLEMGYGVNALIGHTQPRRIAARSVADRVAQELKCKLGENVGFKIRFGDQTSDTTNIKLMTDGILLAEIQSDRFLEQYDAIIIDEAHERSLNIDLLLGLLKKLLHRRKDLRLVITSATIDAERIAAHFGTAATIAGKGESKSSSAPSETDADSSLVENIDSAPIVEVSGRTFPVELRYRPLIRQHEEQQHVIDVFEGIGDAVIELHRNEPGDMLIFLPTEQDIRHATKHLRGMAMQKALGNYEILPLYARLSNAEQNKIFSPGKSDRIVLATNVAESSLTVPRIKYVIDTGTARISRYSARSKVQRLPIESVSQASANQRSGRCGRLGPGVCIRLYSEQDFEGRDAFTTPEIRRTNLASVLLQLKSMKLGDLEQIPFLDPPRPEAVREGYRTLFEIGAVDDRREITPLGRKLAKLPTDPRLGKMILAADAEGCLADVLVIASALEIRDPRDRPADKKQAADREHEKFRDPQSDFLSYIKIWDFFHEQKEKLSHSKLRKACLQNFLSFNRMREWQDIYRQLRKLATEIDLKVGKRTDDYGKIHRALLGGLLSGVANKGDKHEFTGAGGGKFFLWPGSGLFQSAPQWIMASELVETEKRYLRNVAKIDPVWVEKIASHLVKKSYSDPHFSKKNATCMAYEKILLFGLPIVPRRKVHYGKIDPQIARQLFIEQGIVDRQFNPQDGIIAENNIVIDDITNMAHRTRDVSFVLEPSLITQFYERNLPEDVYDAASLNRFWKKAKAEQKKRLEITQEDLIPSTSNNSANEFPTQIAVGSLNIPIKYRFEPGTEDDGVTLKIPKEGVRQLNARQLEWLVPGMMEEKIAALIKSLPKSIRRTLVPAPDTARKVAAEIDFGKGNFLEIVAAHLSGLANEPVKIRDFDLTKIPQHLKVNIEVTDEKGETVAQSRDLHELFQADDIAPESTGLKVDDEKWNQSGLKEWNFGKLPQSIEIASDPITILAYPAVADRQESVDLQLFDTATYAKRVSRMGVMRLYAFSARKSIRSQLRWLPDLSKMQINAASLFSGKQLDNAISDLIALRAFVDGDKELPADDVDFDARLIDKVERTSKAAQEIAPVLPKIFENFQQCRLAIENAKSNQFSHAISDIKKQIKSLTEPGFLTHHSWRWIAEYPRYFNAILARLDKLPQRGGRADSDLAREVNEFEKMYAEQKAHNDSLSLYNEELETFRWMIEEYRVSIFAQTLGTSLKVSATRLEKQWQKQSTTTNV